jgi:hypothetical protein
MLNGHVISIMGETASIATRGEITSPRLKRLMREWESWRGNREFPSRADFTPFDLKYIIGNISLLDVTHDPLQFRFRIHGTNLALRVNREMTHKSIDDMPGMGRAARIRQQLTEVVERRSPVAYPCDTPVPVFPMPRDVEALVLPLSDDGTTINMLISAVVWDSEEIATYPPMLMRQG